MPIFNFHQFESFVSDACDQYERSAPTVADYLDQLYRRISNKNPPVQLQEITGIEKLRDDGAWLQPNYAANMIYHLMTEVGLDTTGQAGF